MDALKQLQLNLGRHSSAYEEEGDDVAALPDLPVRLFAFYLPQFHPIPENDSWWGKGFTEWTNVTKALPRYEGHYQPRLPSDLGFYDLRLPETIRSQVALAQRYGIAGFCFHWYWFSGHRLLERPLEVFLSQQDLDFPFFINWANENWTRRWDGLESTVLMQQRYSEADDIAVADAFLALVRDRRYLRIDGRPVIMLYRPSALPDAAATIERWRRHFVALGESDPMILMPQVFDASDPRPYGIDAAVQFPPHGAGPSIENPERRIHFFNGRKGGAQFDYETVADGACERGGNGFPLIRAVCPAWDNEARKPNAGSSLVGSTPSRYGRWLGRAIRATLQERPLGTNLLLVNAWNEWAEGAHLEPDRHFGHAYLRHTCRVLNASKDSAALDRLIADLRPSEPAAAEALGKDGVLPAAVQMRYEAGRSNGSPDHNARGLVRAVDAERYDGHTEDPYEVAGILRSWMPAGRRVLDIGCGTGSATLIVNQGKKNDVVCIEPDPERAARAQARQLHVHVGSLDESFNRLYGQFDVVMMSDVLEHLPDPSTMLESIHTTLAPDGILLLSVPNVAHWSVRLSLLVGSFEYAPTGIRDATHLRWFTARTIRRLVEESGFEVLKFAETAGQELPVYHRAPWRWMPSKVRRNIAKQGARWMPQLFGCQHVLMCRRVEASATQQLPQ